MSPAEVTVTRDTAALLVNMEMEEGHVDPPATGPLPLNIDIAVARPRTQAQYPVAPISSRRYQYQYRRYAVCVILVIAIVKVVAIVRFSLRGNSPTSTYTFTYDPEDPHSKIYTPNLNDFNFNISDLNVDDDNDSGPLDFPPYSVSGAKTPTPSVKMFVPTLKCETEECHQVAGDLKSFMDIQVDPCEDFYQYSCGGWIKTHKLGKNENETDIFSEVNKANEFIIRDILASVNGTEASAIKKAKGFYSSCINKEKGADDDLLKNYLKHFQHKGHHDHKSQENDHLLLKQLETVFTSNLNNIQPLLPQNSDDSSRICVVLTRLLLPEVVARLFISKTYSLSKQDQISTIVEAIKSSYISKISQLSWMDQRTIDNINFKLDTLPVLLGCPEVVMDTGKIDLKYANISVSRNGSDYEKNFIALLDFRVALINQSIEEIHFANQIKFTTLANAFYAPWSNEIFVPAGISIKPFFDPDYPMLINFAKFATSVGHEASHAFENYVKGFYLKSDQVSTKSFNNFGKCSKCIEHQYDTFLIGVAKNDSLKGNVTFDENFADIAGLQVAFEAYLKFQRDFKLLPGLEEMSQEQLFFIAAAQTQCISFASEEDEETAIEVEIAKDEHSPNSARVLGEMMNFDEFAKAFNCPEGSRYNPVNKCRVFV